MAHNAKTVTLKSVTSALLATWQLTRNPASQHAQSEHTNTTANASTAHKTANNATPQATALNASQHPPFPTTTYATKHVPQ